MGHLPSASVLLVLALAAASVHASNQQQSLQDLDLTKATIQAKLAALPASDDVLIEFFASWCPACRYVGQVGVHLKRVQKGLDVHMHVPASTCCINAWAFECMVMINTAAGCHL